MPHPNRIAPDGTFSTLPQRGAFMGNRGRLHDEAGTIRRRWASAAWITCTLRAKPGRPNPGVLPPRGYTRLFFLDEAVALAAGHRPCAECRRAAYRDFRAAWAAAFGTVGLARDIDRVLRAETTGAHRGMGTGTDKVDLDSLPDHCFVCHQGAAHRIAGDRLIPYRDGAYHAAVARPTGRVAVLTPPAMVAVLRAGYRPADSAAMDRPNW